jgi:hypothetical protein
MRLFELAELPSKAGKAKLEWSYANGQPKAKDIRSMACILANRVSL